MSAPDYYIHIVPGFRVTACDRSNLVTPEAGNCEMSAEMLALCIVENDVTFERVLHWKMEPRFGELPLSIIPGRGCHT